MGLIKLLFLIGSLIVTAVSSWISAFRMRRRIKRSLDQNVSDAELISLNTWMKVEEAEQLSGQSKPIEPR